MSGFGKRYSAFDRFQQRHRWLGFPLAVVQKYADDQGGYLAATITYYAFFAIFPLLLVLTTVLGFVLRWHRHLYQSIVNSALSQFPVIGPELRLHSLHGSVLALGLGLAAALWAGMGVFLAAQNAMNHLWGVPFKRRPDFLRARGRALLLLLLLGGGTLATTILAGVASFSAGYGVAWIDKDGDSDGDGLQEYRTRAREGGYYNQGWKDSGDAIVDAGGELAELPISLCEHQGYVVAAKRAWAQTLEEAYGERRAARRLRAEAERLAELIETRFWWEAEGSYYLGLDGRKRPIESVVSNPGHLLWAEATTPERARRVADRLLAEDMWSGWGIRTLSDRHPAYNPFSYQCGSVWPHDNAIIAAGLRSYGLDEEAARVARAIFDAAQCFQSRRLPELFAGLPRDQGGFPIQYLGANVPQAWAAGAVIQLLDALLGLEPDAPSQSLRLHPALPGWLETVSIGNLTVGKAAVDFSIRRGSDGTNTLEVSRRRGTLEVTLPQV